MCDSTFGPSAEQSAMVQGLEDGKGSCHSLQLSLEGSICKVFGRVALGLCQLNEKFQGNFHL